MGAQTPTLVDPLPVSAPSITPPTIATITTTQQAPLPPTTTLSTLIQYLPNFGSLFGFDNRPRTLEANFFEFMQMNQIDRVVSTIPKILKTIDENMQKIIKEQGDEKDDAEECGDEEKDSDEEEFIHPSISTHAEEELMDEESFDPITRTPKDSDDEGNGGEDLGLNVGSEEGHDEKEEEDELYRDVNINQGRGIQRNQEVEESHVTLTLANSDGQQQSSSVSSQFVTSMLNPTLDVGMESIFETTSQMGAQTPTLVDPLPVSAPSITPPTIATITTTQQAPLPPTTTLSTLIQYLPNFGSLFGFDNRPRTLEANFFEFMQMNQIDRVVSTIPNRVSI
nr:hypothetical protein [Tanacetum cinerariifolium]